MEGNALHYADCTGSNIGPQNQNSLSLLISNLIKLAVAISFFFLSVVLFWFFLKKCGYFHIVKFLETELYFHVVRNPEQVLISVKKCYLGAFPQTWESLALSMPNPSKQKLPHVTVWNLH